MGLIQDFFSLVEKNDKIAIFGHVYPDGDCYSSSQGLKLLLNDLYPDKEVKVTMTDFSSIPEGFPRQDSVSDEFIASALHIFVDISDKKRVADQRGFSIPGTGIVKIDHHHVADDYGGLEIVDESKASCTELLMDVFHDRYVNRPYPQMAASLLLLGIITDSGRFQFSYSPELFAKASRLIQDGGEIGKIYAALNRTTEKVVSFKGYLMSHYQKTFYGVSYIKINYKEGEEYGFTGHSAALFVNTIGFIDASQIFIAFGEDKDGKIFTEIRSVGNELNVQALASKYGGGGHFNASGCTLKDWADADKMIKDADEMILKTFAPYADELDLLIRLGQKASAKILEIYAHGFNVEIKSDNSPVTDADKASDEIIKNGIKKAFPEYGLLTEEDKDDKARLSKDKVFIIDPLDGTSDFVKKDGQFAINLALADKHIPVVGVIVIPLQKAIYFACKGKGAYVKEEGRMIQKIHTSYKNSSLRMLVSACHVSPLLNDVLAKHKDQLSSVTGMGSALKACLISRGDDELAVSLGMGTKEWDTCAPQILIQEAGGQYCDVHGRIMKYNRDDVYNRDGYIITANPACAIFKPEEFKAE